jgi:hypothetical protein
MSTTHNDSTCWTIKAYRYKDGKREMVEWASGFSHKHAREYFQRLYDTNEYAELRMNSVR